MAFSIGSLALHVGCLYKMNKGGKFPKKLWCCVAEFPFVGRLVSHELFEGSHKNELPPPPLQRQGFPGCWIVSALHELVELTADAAMALRALEVLLKLHSRSLACKDFSMDLVHGSQWS